MSSDHFRIAVLPLPLIAYQLRHEGDGKRERKWPGNRERQKKIKIKEEKKNDLTTLAEEKI